MYLVLIHSSFTYRLPLFRRRCPQKYIDISLKIIWNNPCGTTKTHSHNSMCFTYAQINLESPVLNVFFEISSNAYSCLNIFATCHRKHEYIIVVIPCPKRPEGYCRNLRLSACFSIRLSVRVCELACPRDIICFKFGRITLQVKSSGKCDYRCRCSPNMRNIFFILMYTYLFLSVLFLCWDQDTKLSVSGTHSPADGISPHKPAVLSRSSQKLN